MSNGTYNKSEEAAINTLRRFFAGSPDSDEVAVADIFRLTGRNMSQEKKNRDWLANKLSTMRSYDLIDTVYAYEGRRKVDKIKLTILGKRALGRIPSDQLPRGDDLILPPDINPPADRNVSLETVYRDVKILKKQLPSFNVIFKLEPKDEA